jgi:hypothetical protein
MLCITPFAVHFQSLMLLGLNWVNKIEMKQSSSSVDPKKDVLDMVSRRVDFEEKERQKSSKG